MQLSLARPAIVFDLETTGTSISLDRIIELSVIKIYPDGSEETKTRRINPGMHIPEASTAVHGITDEDVTDCPSFAQIAKDLFRWIEGCDLIGFNSNRFDVPMLAEEFLRAGIDPKFNECHLVDVQVLFHKMEPRNLSAGYKFYTGKILEDAHSAEADTRATYEILQAQLDRYPEDLTNDIMSLSEASSYRKMVDYAGVLAYNDEDVIILNIGKYKGQALRSVLEHDPGYYNWVMRGDFTLDTKKWFTRIYNEMKQ